MSLTKQTLDYVAGLVKQRSAIQLPTGEEYLVKPRLIPLVRQAGFDGTTAVDKWVQTVIATRKPDDLQDIAEALTTNETSLFHDVTPLKGLTELAILQLQQNGHSNISIWLMACSTGQEPYFIATSILNLLNPPQFLIVATDLSRAILTKTRQSPYTQLEINRGLPAPMLVRYFQRENVNWTISPKLWQKVNFIEHSLMSTLPKDGSFHIVFIRNALIYFNLDAKRATSHRVANTMAPDGYLFPGTAETTMDIDPVWERITPMKGAAYRLKGGAK